MDYDPNSAVIGIPQEAPEGAVLREDETALEMLERVKDFNLNWVRKGHRRGPNTNNVSATVSVKRTFERDSNGNILKDDNNNPIIKLDEWKDVGNWMWDNRETFNGLSVLPYDGGTYRNAPFEECTREEFDFKVKYIEEHGIDLTLIKEEDDNTDLAGEAACAGGACEVI